MTTQTEALKALVHEMEYVLSCINEDKIPFDGDDFHEALRLGKEALAQPYADKATLSNDRIKIDPVTGNVSIGTVAQPEQEPVPDLYVKDINGNFHSHKEKGHTVSSQCVQPSHVGVGEDDFTPQRKPLTDEQIQYAFRTNSVVIDDGNAYMVAGKRAINIARAIEAAHGIKE